MSIKRSFYRNNVARPARTSSLATRLYTDFKTAIRSLKTSTKWALVVAAKSVVVSFILGAIAPYATAYYAIRNGFRVPVEGVPYIQFAIAIASFSSFFIAMAMLAATMTALQQITLFNHIAQKLKIETEESTQFRKNFYGSKVVIATAILSVPTAYICVEYFSLRSKEINFLITTMSGEFSVYLISISASVVLTGFYFNAREYSLIGMQTALSFPLVIIMAASLFADSSYGSFLRIIRYGGGIEVTLQTESEHVNGKEEITGYLMIQNDRMAIVMTKDLMSFVEIPSSKITRKIVTASPSWKSPAYSTIEQLNLLP
jgi:hypothetical protein